jgi:hypothetical protein
MEITKLAQHSTNNNYLYFASHLLDIINYTLHHLLQDQCYITTTSLSDLRSLKLSNTEHRLYLEGLNVFMNFSCYGDGTVD